ncbi:PP2C family protein-serine/threonine phosphatase [Phytohabitans aurantiacus]|uniref:PP2C family protein-serine/threonine phosphatase n=1 Tax=Phytohabitans aurantiacus TaxID=3016789 RepID=UPI0024900782|nr:GAF domain-containing SpoIIE family protein phosphatase [Phytohabitans aurantiacus]
MIRSGGSGSDEQLRRIEAVTDAALSQLRSEDLLDALLERACDLMGVDTAVVLLLDVHAQQLVATAAKGLEVEVEQEFRLAVGRGFAGRVARDRQPVIIPDLSVADIANPLLREKGLSSMLGVPMLAAGELVGVLHVGSLTPREFTDDDIHLLQLVAERATLAAQVRSSEIDRMAALALQRSLLPSRLPAVPGLDLAARYQPGHDTGVGGDWYDVFHLPSGWLGVVIGDVSGHGLPSAVVMGRLRSALRAYSLECESPADALARLDRKIHHFEAGSLATALYGMISPDREQMVISLAGHPPPVLAAPDRDAAMVAVPTDLPLGTGRSEPRRSTTIDLPAGSVLVCYTDGLVERRGEFIDEGLERLRRTVEPAPADVVCANVISVVASDKPTDDVALLAIRRT